MRRRRSFTLIELLVALVLLGILYTISLSVFNAVYSGGQTQQVQYQIQTALSDGLRVASLPGNHNTFPTSTVSSIVMPSPLSVISGGPSTNVLSGYVVLGADQASNELLVTGYMNGMCLLGLSTANATFTWGQSKTSQSGCAASNFASVTDTITGSQNNPSLVTS